MGKTLSIVVPAYNEEDSIQEILTKCLAAGEALKREEGLSRVEVLAVDDGSRDRTRELAAKVPGAKLVVHSQNRGYGAALMTGFEAAEGDYLAFLDADGTCDPLSFVELYRALLDQDAAKAIGNRLHPGSRMPRVRELGNRVYAFLLSKLTGVPVTDTASGMRLFKRELLQRMQPLPSGLHFTPAMTARAACLGVRIAEVPIPYAERQGESKLNVVADGIRFLRVILGTIFAYFPLRIFVPLGLLFVLVAMGLGVGPAAYYLRYRCLREDVIYRLLTILTLTVCGLISLSSGLIAQKISDLATGRPSGLLDAPRLRAGAAALGAALAAAGILLNSRTILEYVSSGRITLHWVYVLTGGLAVISGTVLFCFGVTLDLVSHLPPIRPGAPGPEKQAIL